MDMDALNSYTTRGAGKMSVSVEDVAKLAQVSKSTVSRFLNNGYVSEEKKIRIKQAIETLGYVSNQSARALKSKRLNAVALFVPTIDHPFFSRLANCIEKALYNRHMRMILVSSEGDAEKERGMIGLVNEKSVGGSIVVTHNAYPDIPDDIPIVTIDRHFGKNVPCITSDNYAATYKALQYLFDNGAKHIGFLGGRPIVESEVSERFRAYLDFCNQKGLVPSYSFDPLEHGQEYQVAKKFLSSFTGLDAVFCASDLLAYGVYQLVPHEDLPKKFKIISFDGVTEKWFSYVRLTSVTQDVQALADLSVDILMKRIAGEPVESKYVVPTKFTKGETA